MASTMQAQFQALLSGDAGTFQALITALLSPDNNTRGQAEAVFQQLLLEGPDATAQHLVQSIRHASAVEMRSFAAVMLRKVLTRDEPSLWGRLTLNSRLAIKSELLVAVKEESEQFVARKVCDTVSELAVGVLESKDDGWEELLPFMFQCVHSGEERLMEHALNIFANLASIIASSLRNFLGTMYQVVSSCLAHDAVPVRLAALRAVTAFVQNLEAVADRNQFQPLLEAMLNVVSHALVKHDEVAATEAMELFIEIADTVPRFLKKELVPILNAFLQIARHEELEDTTRQTAAEFLVCLCDQREKAPGMMRKQVQFVMGLFETLMLYLLDIEDEPSWHEADSEEFEDKGEGQLYEFGQECLDRIAISLGGKTIVPLAGQFLPIWLQDADWKKRHATLICLAQVAEGCQKVMQDSLDALTDMCVKGLSDPHPKVRWSACQSVGQMCTDLGPSMQNTQHAKILPGLMVIMDDFGNPRVQAHACAAMVNFSENCEPEVMTGYLDDLIGRLLRLLQTGRRMVQEGALTAMASVADCAQATFERYYDQVMPLLRMILGSATEKHQQLLRAKALECISLVGMAVGRDRFRADAQAVMQLLHQLHASQLADDDPTTSYMHQAGARLCKCLGHEFVPFLQTVMPSLLKAAALKPDVKIADADDADGDDDDNVEVIMLGEKKIQIKTSTLDEKATACSMLCCYADELKEHFLPYVHQVLEIMLPCLTFYIHEEVRKAAVQSLPELLRSMVRAVEAGGMGADDSHVKQLVDSMWRPLLEALGKEPDMEVVPLMVEAMDEIVELAAPKGLSLEHVDAGFAQLKAIMEKAEERRQERLKQQQAEDFDEDEAEALEEENELDEELLDQVGSAVGCFLKKFGDAALRCLEGLMPAVGALLADGRSTECRRIAICVIDDLLEHCPEGGQRYVQSFMPILLGAAAAPDAPDLRQCAAYGLGCVVGKQPAAFGGAATEIVNALVGIINAPGATEEANAMATDNAVSALGKVIAATASGSAPAGIDPAALATVWLGALPLRADPVEAVTMHAQLLDMCEAGSALIAPHVDRACTVLVEVLGGGPAMLDAAHVPRAVAFLRGPSAANSVNSINAAVGALQPKAAQRFQAAMAGTPGP